MLFIVQVPAIATSDREVKEVVIRKVRLQCYTCVICVMFYIINTVTV